MTTPAQKSGGGVISALLLATHSGREKEIRSLLTAGFDVNLADSDGITPLMASAMNGNVVIARLLLDAGANPRVRNKWGMNAHAIAVWHGYSALAALLDDSAAAEKGGPIQGHGK